MRAIVLAIGLLAAACGEGSDVTLRPTDALSDATSVAMALWNPVLARCGREFTTTADDPDATVEFGNAGGGHYVGVTSYGLPIRVRLEPGLVSDHPLLIHSLAHELGHVLGAPESDRIEDLMYPDDLGGVTPTAHDAKLVGCDQ